MLHHTNYLNESFNNKFIRDIILNNEYLKYIPANTYKPTDIVEIIRNHTTYDVYEDNSIYYKIEKAYNDLYIAYSKLLTHYAVNYLLPRKYTQDITKWDITKYFNENKAFIIEDQNLLAIRVKDVKVKFKYFIKLMNDYINGTFNVTLDTPETKRFEPFSKLRDEQIQDITENCKQNLSNDTLDFYIDNTLKPAILQQSAVILIVDKDKDAFTIIGRFEHETPYILRYYYSSEYIKNKTSLRKIKKYWKDILKNDITTYKINDNYEIPLFKNITKFSYIQEEFSNFINKNNEINNAEHGYPLNIMYEPIKDTILNGGSIYILDINVSINKAHKLPFINYDDTLNNKNVITKNNKYYHPLKNELEKLYDIWQRIYNYLIKEDNIDEKTLVPCERIFTQLPEYMDKHSFVMFGPLNYNVILMHNRLYDILNTTIKPLVLDIYNIVRKGNLTIKQQNRINDILNNIKSYDKTINKIITHNNA